MGISLEEEGQGHGRDEAGREVGARTENGSGYDPLNNSPMLAGTCMHFAITLYTLSTIHELNLKKPSSVIKELIPRSRNLAKSRNFGD